MVEETIKKQDDDLKRRKKLYEFFFNDLEANNKNFGVYANVDWKDAYFLGWRIMEKKGFLSKQTIAQIDGKPGRIPSDPLEIRVLSRPDIYEPVKKFAHDYETSTGSKVKIEVGEYFNESKLWGW